MSLCSSRSLYWLISEQLSLIPTGLGVGVAGQFHKELQKSFFEVLRQRPGKDSITVRWVGMECCEL